MRQRCFSTSERLIVYGTLAPGRVNHHEVSPLGGAWTRGWITGELLPSGWGAALGYPALRWRADGARVDAWLLFSARLPAEWPRLDAFEGDAYRRIVIPFVTETGLVRLGQVYAAREAESGPV